MIVLNLSAPISREDLSTVSALCGRKARRVIDLSPSFTEADPLAPQVRAMLDGLGFSASEWQNQSIVVNLPADPVTAALIVADVAGRHGRTPSVVRWKRRAGGDGVEPAEVISLHEIRKEARHMRKGRAVLFGRSSNGED